MTGMSMVEELARTLSELRPAVVFSGAGMSTESGVPDFRSPGGAWTRVDMARVATPEAITASTDEFQAFFRDRIADLLPIKPNRGHQILADWERRGLITAVVTQNIDGLHQAAGSRQVIEVHGNLREIECVGCRKVFPARDLLTVTRCQACQGILRPRVVLFGEALPMAEFETAERFSQECSLFLVLGSSLQVSPANLLPLLAKQHGARLAIINRMETPLDALADWVVQEGLGETLEAIDRCLPQG